MLLPNDGTSEHQYLVLVRDIKTHGHRHMDRTGVGTLSVHGRTLRFDVSGNVLPLLTTKRIPVKLVWSELRWMLRGESNIRSLLQEKNTIWSEWPHARYQKETGEQMPLAEFEQRIVDDEAFAQQWGDLGPVYGVQWRRWQGHDGKQYDQIQQVLDTLRKNPGSRRILFHGWNVAEVEQMALPPCHLLYQFYVAGDKLSLTLYQRSCDTALGVPFNIASAAMLLHAVARETGFQAHELFWVGHDVHLYLNHLEPIEEQLARTPRPFPTFRWREGAGSLFELGADDLIVENYKPDPAIKMSVAV